MSISKSIFISLTILLSSIDCGFCETRTWTQAGTGKTLEGDLVRVLGDKILITRTNGNSVEIPVTMLAEADQTYVKEWQAAKDAADEEPEAQSTAEIPEGEIELVLEDAHLCCAGCRKAVEGALGSLSGVEVSTVRSDITIKAETGSLAKTAMEYIMKKGIYGEPDHPAFAVENQASEDKKDSVTVTGVHLCCDKCAAAAEKALKRVDGVDDIEGLEKKAREFSVTGEVSPKDLLDALHGAGFHGAITTT